MARRKRKTPPPQKMSRARLIVLSTCRWDHAHEYRIQKALLAANVKPMRRDWHDPWEYDRYTTEALVSSLRGAGLIERVRPRSSMWRLTPVGRRFLHEYEAGLYLAAMVC